MSSAPGKREKLTKAEALIANQLQVSRVFGETTTLGEKYDIPQIQIWSRGIATALAAAGFNLAEAGRAALKGASHE